MKNLQLLIVFSIFNISLYSQITLNHSFDYSANITKINATEYKYFLMDVVNEQCRIYNTDFSIYKTINLDIPEGEWLYDIRFVSQDLFNSDASIELLYTYYKWITTNTNNGDGYYIYHSKVVCESGSVLLDAPGALYSYVKEVGPDEYKLFLFAYDLSVDPYTIKTNIYSLPGQLNIITEGKKASFSISAFPNPAHDFLELDYSLPAGTDTGQLYMTDSRGKVHQVFEVDGFTNYLKINTENFSPGVYFYYLDANGQKSKAKKIIIR